MFIRLYIMTIDSEERLQRLKVYAENNSISCLYEQLEQITHKWCERSGVRKDSVNFHGEVIPEKCF